MEKIAIKATNLTKKFDGLVAVDNVTISINRGELFGLLGPNGAGKTTLIAMLSTMLRPTSGTAELYGYLIEKDPVKVRRSIGVVFQDTTLDERLTGRENLELHGRLYGMDRQTRQRRIKELLELVELDDRADDIVKTYSGGMMRRLEIARGLIHRPKILFLDEPTLGLDPQTRNHIWDYIKKLNAEEDVTMVLTTHYMEEADNLCERIAIIDKGKIVAMASPAELKSELGGDIITLTAASEDVASGLADLIDYCKNLPQVSSVSKDGLTVMITATEGEKAIPELLSMISKKSDFKIESVSLRKPTLDDVFLYHTGRKMRSSGMDDMQRLRYMMRTRKR